ncbi:dioxygenase isopenicillin N synthase (plasmid) [Candidatus Megaera polyxenophila]|nr:dioxygenase isopenicillin N synthase [Candidatus Megaera polyxenophila]
MDLLLNYNDKRFLYLLTVSLKKKGYAVLSNYDFDSFLIDAAYSSFYEFFSSNEKKYFQGDLTVPYGYFGLKKKGIKTSYEDFYFYKGMPKCPEYLSNILYTIVSKMEYLGFSIINHLIKEFFKNKQYQGNIVHDLKVLLRMIFYHGVNQNSSSTPINPEHTDKSFITILPAATCAGLEYYNGHWQEIYIGKQELLIMCGDKLANFTEGYFLPLKHRVITKSVNTINVRQSMAIFFG